MAGKDNFLSVFEELLSRYGSMKLAEGRRREKHESKNIPYVPKTDDDIIDDIWEQMGWENILEDE